MRVSGTRVGIGVAAVVRNRRRVHLLRETRQRAQHGAADDERELVLLEDGVQHALEL